MNKKYVFSSLLFVSLLLTGCNSSSVIAMSAEEARDNIISNFTDVDPETLKYKFEGVSNIFNRSFEGAKEIYNGPGYEHRETTLQNFKASTTSNYLRILNHVNDSSWFAYKGSEAKSLNLEDEFCGGCKVELSLNFIEKLKTNKMLSCEHCGRIIMFK